MNRTANSSRSPCLAVPHFSAASRGPHPPASRGRKACGGPENASGDRAPPLSFHAQNPSFSARIAVDFNTDLPGRARACAALRKNYTGHKVRPAARRSNFYRSKVTYRGEPGFCRTHTLQCTLLSSRLLFLFTSADSLALSPPCLFLPLL